MSATDAQPNLSHWKDIVLSFLRSVWPTQVTRGVTVPDATLGKEGHIALVGAGPGAADLLTVRAANRIKAADVVLYDRLVDPEVVDLAPASARRIFVGKEVGACAWPQQKINALMVNEALQGGRVVRLKSGDPSIFGRATEEIDAAHDAGIEVELVPGVTSATAAAAALGRSMTTRNMADTLVLATGTGQHADVLPDCTRYASPGTTMVFYMAVRQARRISDELVAKGMPADSFVEIAANVSKPGEKLLRCRLDQIEATLRDAGVRNCALLIVTWPTPATADAPVQVSAPAQA